MANTIAKAFRTIRVCRDLLDRLAQVQMPPYVGTANENRAEYAISRFLDSGSETGNMGVEPELSRIANKRGQAAIRQP